MLSNFRLSFFGDQLASKDKVGLENMRPSSVVEIPMLNKFKRQLSDSSDFCSQHCAPPIKKPRLEVETSQKSVHVGSRVPGQFRTIQPVEQVTHASAPVVAPPPHQQISSNEPTSLSTETRSSTTMNHPENLDTEMSNSEPTVLKGVTLSPSQMIDTVGDLTPLQQVIENEFNMAILLKHNELRLIEQELARCQVGLEQLRRCELRPYPGHDQPSTSVSEGTGAAILPPPGHSRPAHPAPHGVTDGPYSRHYRQWLLHDPLFESGPLQLQTPVDTPTNAGGRSTRNLGSVRKSVSSKTHAVSNRTDSLHSIPNYPAAMTKDKNAPLVLRRSTDNQLVKLICNNCLRGNFSSIQGFLNHCRIAHKVDYKSHDLAAIDCGRPLDESEMANLPPDTPTCSAAPTPRSHVSRASTSAAVITPNKIVKDIVHPLNSPAGAVQTPSLPASSARAAPVRSLDRPTPPALSSAPLKQSSQVPRLSAFFAKKGLGGDLEQAFANAKQIVDFNNTEDELLTPDTPDFGSLMAPHAGSRMPMSSRSDGQRPPSRKGYRQPSGARPRPSALMSASMQDPQTPRELVQSPQNASATYSPHAADSNPGLVGDHEDDDHGSAVSDEDAPHAEMPHHLPVGGHCSDNVDIEMSEQDHLEHDRVFIRRSSLLDGEGHAVRRNAGNADQGCQKGGK